MKSSATFAFCSLGALVQISVAQDIATTTLEQPALPPAVGDNTVVPPGTTATPTTGFVTVMTNIDNTATNVDITATPIVIIGGTTHTGFPPLFTANSTTGLNPGQGGTTMTIVNTLTDHWSTITQSNPATGTSATTRSSTTSTTTSSSTQVPGAAGTLPTIGLGAKALVAGAVLLIAVV